MATSCRRFLACRTFSLIAKAVRHTGGSRREVRSSLRLRCAIAPQQVVLPPYPPNSLTTIVKPEPGPEAATSRQRRTRLRRCRLSCTAYPCVTFGLPNANLGCHAKLTFAQVVNLSKHARSPASPGGSIARRANRCNTAADNPNTNARSIASQTTGHNRDTQLLLS